MPNILTDMQMDGTKWHVYILRCSDGTFYTGITNNIKRRFDEHNRGIGAKYTKGRCPVALVYLEESDNRSAASKRESEIKKLSKHGKSMLIQENM